MKTITILLAGFSLLFFLQLTKASTMSDNPQETTTVQTATAGLKVSSSPELYNLTRNWVKDFTISQPATLEITVSVVDNHVKAIENLTLVTEGNSAFLSNPSNWKMVIGRDIIVPIVNQKNPMFQQLKQTGVSAARFTALFNNPVNSDWQVLLSDAQKVPVRLYLVNDESIQTGLQGFAGTTISNRDLKSYQTATEMISAVAADQFALGFCKLNDLKAYNTSAVGMEVALLPIDKNGNGRIDNFENIYNSLDEFAHGVWIGKYPKSLTSDIYAISTGKPESASEIAFLSWIMADGQQLLSANGYCHLTSSEQQTNIASLLGTTAIESREVTSAPAPQSWPVALTVTFVVGLFLVIFFYSKKSVEAARPERELEIAPKLIEQVVNVPNGLYFDKTHTWAFMEQDGNVRIGIDDFLQHITGKLIKIKMKETGEKVRKGETIMTIIQNGKQLNIYAPISGTIVSHNELLYNDTAVINSSPFFKGWVYQIEPTNWLREAQFMLMGEKYREWLRDEFVRLKDFIASALKSNELAYSHVVLQDGGELTDNILADLDPKVWEDFQTQFMDTSR